MKIRKKMPKIPADSRPDRPVEKEKSSGWRWLDPSNIDERASRVPWDVRASQSPFHPCLKQVGTPGTPLGPGGNKKVGKFQEVGNPVVFQKLGNPVVFQKMGNPVVFQKWSHSKKAVFIKIPLKKAIC